MVPELRRRKARPTTDAVRDAAESPRRGRRRHDRQIVATPALGDPDHLNLPGGGSYPLLVDVMTGFVCSCVDLRDWQQHMCMLKQFVVLGVGSHSGDGINDRGVWALLPDEGHQRHLEDRHRTYVNRHSAYDGDAPRHAQRRIEHPIWIRLDHELEAGLDHLAGDFHIRRLSTGSSRRSAWG